jgi:hypothetical protein
MNNTKITHEDITVTPESIATAGLISYWRLSGPIALDQLTEAWKRADLNPELLPKPPGDEVALGRAVREQAAKRRLVRPLARRGAWAIVDETIVGEALDYKQVTSVAFVEGSPVFGVDASYDLVVDKLRQDVLAAYNRHRGELSPEDISGWLIKLADKNNAVTLRDTGGIYFVPRTNVPFWRSVVQAIESVSAHRVFKIPAMKNSEAIEAITEAVTIEAARLVDTMMAELQQTGDDKLGDRALTTRANACKDLLTKVKSYEDLLGVQMTKVVERVEGLQAGIASAALLVGAEDAAA